MSIQLFDSGNVDGQMKRYIETLSATITRLTKAVEANEAKVINAENNYVMLMRRHTDLENENKDLRKSMTQTQDRMSQLEGALAQQRRGLEDAESRNNRRILDSESELKELSRRLDRTGTEQTESKLVGNAEIQMIQTRLSSLSEEVRMTVENGKRWNDNERERIVRDLTETIRNMQIKFEADVRDLRNFTSQLENSQHNEIELNGKGIRRNEDKVKQIIDRVKSNEVRYRDKHQSHKSDIVQVQRELETNLETIAGTVENLTQVLNGKIALAERQFKAEIATLKKLVVLADG